MSDLGDLLGFSFCTSVCSCSRDWCHTWLAALCRYEEYVPVKKRKAAEEAKIRRLQGVSLLRQHAALTDTSAGCPAWLLCATLFTIHSTTKRHFEQELRRSCVRRHLDLTPACLILDVDRW